MRVQPVLLECSKNLTKLPAITDKQQASNECEPNSNARSIYSKGMSAIAFGNLTKGKNYDFIQEAFIKQPEALANNIEKANEIDLGLTNEEAKKINNIHIVATGSSLHAAEMAQDFIQEKTNANVILHPSGESKKKNIPYKENDIVVVISQSGESSDTIEAMKNAEGKVMKTIAITNKSDSTIAKMADRHICLGCDEEKAVAATGTVTNTNLQLMLMGVNIAGLQGKLTPEDKEGLNTEFQILPEKVDTIIKNLEDSEEVKKAAEVIANAKTVFYASKFAGARDEYALKVCETSKKDNARFDSADGCHGPHGAIHTDDAMVVILDNNTGKDTIEDLTRMLNKRKTENIVVIQPDNMEEVEFPLKDGTIKPKATIKYPASKLSDFNQIPLTSIAHVLTLATAEYNNFDCDTCQGETNNIEDKVVEIPNNK